MIFLITWWLIGVISFLVGCVIIDKELTPENIFDSLYIDFEDLDVTGFLIYLIIKDKKILSNIEVPQKYKDLWKKNLLDITKDKTKDK